MKRRWLIFLWAIDAIFFIAVVAHVVAQSDHPKPVLQPSIDCMVQKDEHGASHLLCRDWYKPATAAQKQAFCREQWRQFLKPYRQSGRPPANASMEGCEDVSQPRFTDEELERP